MANELHRFPPLSGIAASSMAAQTVVGFDSGDVQFQFVAVATVNVEPYGISRSVASNAGDAVTVWDHGQVARAVAGASLGHGTDVGVASTNGALGPVSGASGFTKWATGKSLTAAAPGETFSLLIRPRQLSGLV